jgi:elongation factor P hydroxylase
MSDFGYWSWPLGLVGGYEQIRSQISEVEHGLRFGSKIKLAMWRGAVKTNNHRKDLINVVKGGEHWADVKSIRWANTRKVKGKDEGIAISIPDHCRYQFVIHTEGCHLYLKQSVLMSNARP